MTKEEVLNQAWEAYNKNGVPFNDVINTVYDIAERNGADIGYSSDEILVQIVTRGLEGKMWAARKTISQFNLHNTALPYHEALRMHLTAIFNSYIDDMVYIAKEGAAAYELKRMGCQ